MISLNAAASLQRRFSYPASLTIFVKIDDWEPLRAGRQIGRGRGEKQNVAQTRRLRGKTQPLVYPSGDNSEVIKVDCLRIGAFKVKCFAFSV